MIETLEGDAQNNSSEIHLMEHFIQQKYSQVGDLQKYLIEELQFIESSKNKHKMIEKLVLETIIPTIS